MLFIFCLVTGLLFHMPPIWWIIGFILLLIDGMGMTD